MEILKFKLSGRTAFFKKPDVNQIAFFTYGNIHKPALLGIIGATLGISGYSEQAKNKYPKYYEKLKELKVSIVPCKEGTIGRTIQTYNNSTGFWNKSACKKGGSNLIVKEQWLINPSWDIYIDLNHPKGEVIKNTFVNKSFVFNPYLGNNSHPADIKDIEILDIREDCKTKNYTKIDSIFDESVAQIDSDYDIEDEEYDIIINPFRLSETLPMGLTEGNNHYIYCKMVYTNMKLQASKEVLNIGDKNIYFI